MTNLETNLLEVLTREAVRFCSRAVRLFPAPLAQMRTALIQDRTGPSRGRTGHMINFLNKILNYSQYISVNVSPT